MRKLFFLATFSAFVTSAIVAFSDPAPVRNQVEGSAAEGKNHPKGLNRFDPTKVDLTKLSKEEYQAFSKELIEASDEEKEEFVQVSKEMLVTMFGWQSKPESQKKIFDLDPLWNRRLILVVIAVHNKIRLSDSEIETFRKESAAVRLKTDDDGQRLLISGLYDNVLRENDALKEAEIILPTR